MKFLVDMNLSAEWCAALAAEGWEALHWSEVGDPRADDSEIMDWARDHGCIVLTHDLDFGAMLAVTGARGPSTVQVRTQDVLPDSLGPVLIPLLKSVSRELAAGALVVADRRKNRVRVLPLKRSKD